jgi:glycosyltransferase involved in cell wall biosynthesis
MNLLVLTDRVPFVRRDIDALAASLARELRLRGVDAEVMGIPVRCGSPEQAVDALALCRSLQLSNVDRVVALEFPACLVPHRDKVVWVPWRSHEHGGHAAAALEPEIGRIVRQAERICFAEAERLFCGSAPMQAGMRRRDGTAAEILLPPIDEPELFFGADYGDYVLASGRVNRARRQGLLVEAMRHVRSGLRLVIAGPPDRPADAEDLRRAAAGLGDCVALELRRLPRAELAALVNGARAVVSLPEAADSLGADAMEAFQAAKPVVTVSDAGGLLDFVEPGKTGLVAAPTPTGLAAAIDSLTDPPDEAARLGRAGRVAWLDRDVTWSATLDRLLS